MDRRAISAGILRLLGNSQQRQKASNAFKKRRELAQKALLGRAYDALPDDFPGGKKARTIEGTLRQPGRDQRTVAMEAGIRLTPEEEQEVFSWARRYGHARPL
jgi:hypothetical protein